MIHEMLEVGTKVKFKDADTGFAGYGEISGTIGSVPPLCPLEEVLYLIQTYDEPDLQMWHFEIQKVIV